MNDKILPDVIYPEEFLVEFDEKNETSYRTCISCLPCCVSLIGIPFTLCAPCIAHKQTKAQSCQINQDKINYKSGWINKVDKVIPIDRIQDISVLADCTMRCCNIQALSIQTAGGSGPSGAEAVLLAPRNAVGLRNELIARRDALQGKGAPMGRPQIVSEQPGKMSMDIGDAGLRELQQIRMCLQRMEAKQEAGQGGMTGRF
jgi:membrane protein YdbS with pleckstrin-like domain